MFDLKFKLSKDRSHEYTVRNRENDKDYIALFDTINSFGVYSFFYKKRYKHIIVDGFRYWIMTSDINESIIINRCVEAISNEFDCLADTYDEVYLADEYVKEEEQFADKYLQGLENRIVLEVCCGTGNLYRFLGKTHYKGCDISYKMLEQFKMKHQDTMLFHCNVKSLTLDQKADFAFVSFGGASLLTVGEINAIAGMVKLGGVVILSYYKKDYTPLTGSNNYCLPRIGVLIEENSKYEIYKICM